MSSIASSSKLAAQAYLARRLPLAVPALRPLPPAHIPHRTLRFRRTFATHPEQEGRGFKVSYLFGGLASLGLLVTIYGLLEYYYSLQTWPEPIRTPLKAALKAKNRGDYDRSEVYFRKAIEAALSLPSSSLEPDALEKLSGLYIALSGMLESQGSVVAAFSYLRDALDHFGASPLVPSSPTGSWAGHAAGTSKDHLRAIGLSQKLGQLALEISGAGSGAPPYPLPPGDGPTGWTEAAERYLEGALTAMLKLGLSPSASAGGGGQVIAGRDIQLPSASAAEEDGGGRVDKRGLGMTMESLAEVYARQGKYDLAGQLLLQAVSLLLPPGKSREGEAPPTMRDQCQAAMLMTTISSHALHPPSPQSIRVASSWSLKALQVADGVLEKGDKNDPGCKLCGRAKAVGLYNLGMLAEMQNNTQEAADNFSRSLMTAKEYGFNEGRREASDAIRRIQSRVGGSS